MFTVSKITNSNKNTSNQIIFGFLLKKHTFAKYYLVTKNSFSKTVKGQRTKTLI
jgi:hypothetical protein